MCHNSHRHLMAGSADESITSHILNRAMLRARRQESILLFSRWTVFEIIGPPLRSRPVGCVTASSSSRLGCGLATLLVGAGRLGRRASLVLAYQSTATRASTGYSVCFCRHRLHDIQIYIKLVSTRRF